MTKQPVIHVGVDGSWRDTGALEWALQESSIRKAPLRVVHVIDEKLRYAPYWEPKVVDDAALDLVEEVQQTMTSRDPALDHSTQVVLGPPATTLAELASGSLMLVVGRRGMSTVKRLLVGSTSEAVANLATVPVIVVPDGWTPSGHPGTVVVGLDDSGESEAAVEFAAEAAIERGSALRMVHVWDLPPIYSWESMEVEGALDSWSRTAELHFEAVAGQWRQKYPDLPIAVDVRRGHAVDGLLSSADAVDAQLLVIGGRHHLKVISVLLGSVARGVLQHATCPVAVIRLTTDDA
ncbi:universal stress protein [Kribbella sp. NPDC051620]|uniref:universal stress protein n=1 Tax=Kribbella sp. NPDC051620 TaxID=3364120 RepID=UPI0037B7FE9D